MGEARGIIPGRVVWSHAPGTASWKGGSDMWFDDKNTSQEACDWMMAETLMGITGERTVKDAWNTIFTHYNRTNGRGDVGYVPGQKIAVKINNNNTASHQDSREINATPQMVLALIRSMVEQGGVRQEDMKSFTADGKLSEVAQRLNIFLDCAGFQQRLYLASLEIATEVFPVRLQMSQYLPVAAEALPSSRHQRVMQLQQLCDAFLFIPFCSFVPFGKQRRPRYKSTAGHYACNARITLGNRAYPRRFRNVSIINHRMAAIIQEAAEFIHIRFAGILLRRYARMYRDMLKRHLVDDSHNASVVRGVVDSETHFNRKFNIFKFRQTTSERIEKIGPQ